MGLNNIKINNTTNVKTGVVYDISEANDGATYTDLTDALGTNGGVPAEFRESGMSIKFIQTSDNKYVQYRLISNSWSVNPYFWESYNDVTTSNQQDSDLDISDEQGNVLMRLTNGHIQVKNFSSIDALDSIQAIISNIGFDNIPEFSEEEDYAIGDIIKYEKYVYVFTSNHTAGEWDETEVEKTVVYNNPVEVADDNKADLDISDENGNVLVKFANGHVKVKNFDSADNNESISAILQNIGIDDIPVFDEEEDYEIGVIVRYNKLIYKFISVHEAGEWNSSDVEETNIIDELDVEHPVAVETILSDADLDISDENGNVLARFSNGHIKTKNFNSSAIKKENLDRTLQDEISTKTELEGANVLICGDSITYGEGLPSPVNDRWGQKLAYKYNWNVTINAQSGRPIGAHSDASTNIQKKVEIIATMTTKPDLVIVWGGVNDVAYTTAPMGSFADTTETSDLITTKADRDSTLGGIRYIIEVIRHYAPKAKIVLLTQLHFVNWDGGSKQFVLEPSKTRHDLDMAIIEGGHKYGYYVADMGLCGINENNVDICTSDGYHPNQKGTKQIVAYLSKFLESIFFKFIND